MTQPFVVSLKLTGDGRGAVSAVTSTAQALEQLNAKTDAAKARAEALNAALGRRSGAEANRSGLQATLEAIQAEQRLESARLQAQITEKGRADSINRLAQLGRDAAQVNKAIASSEQQVAAAYDESARAARTAALAGRELVTAQNTAMRSRQASINAALGIGAQSNGDRGADIAAFGREMDRLRALYVPTVAASQAYNRELDGINQAHRVGAITAQEQAAAIAALDARYRAAAASAKGLQGAQRSGGGASSFHTTNLLFQAQDIAMMTAMGQAPMMLAMQQGTQVGGIFHQIGNGRDIVKALGGAIVGLLNPLNLATIAAIGLGAAGVQAFMNMGGEAEDATTALERHGDMLDRLLPGYDKVRKAADAALNAASRLPEGVIASDLLTSLKAQEEALTSIGRTADDLSAKFAAAAQILKAQDGGSGQFAVEVAQIEALRELNLTASSTRAELDAATTAARDLFNTTKDPVIKDWADEFYTLAIQLRETLAIIESTDEAIRGLERNVQIRIAVAQEFTSATEGLQALYMDPRSRFDIAREQAKNFAEQQMATAQTYGQLTGAATQYERVLASINAAEAEANEKANARDAKAANKPFEQWKSANDNFQQRIDQQRLEIELLGQSTYEIERQKAAFDLRNQARAAGVTIDDTVNGQIERMAQQYASATVELERLREQQRLADEQLQFYRGTFVSFFADMKSGLRDGQNFWEAFGNAGANALDRIADRALGMAANGLFDMIFGAVVGGLTGSASGFSYGPRVMSDPWAGLRLNAHGNVYGSPALADYRNTIVDQPTLFAFAQGAGIMGEAGAEAIIPLTRTASGDLGVRMVGGGTSMGYGQNQAPVTNNYYINAQGSRLSRAEFEAILDAREQRQAANAPAVMADARHRAVRGAA